MKEALPLRILAVVALLAAGAMLPGYTFYEIETAAGPIPLRWYTDTVDVFHDAALTADTPADAVLDAIDVSMDTWNAVACDHVTLVNAGPVTDGSAFEIDRDTDSKTGTNLIIFEDADTWAANHSGSQWDVSLTVALTTVFHSALTGEIRSFALEINDSPFTFGIEPEGYAFDIQNTVTHELGHVLGLDHTGSDIGDWTLQTMYFQTEPGETLKRSLEADDTAGFCELYSADWKADVPVPGGSCTASANPGQGLPAAIVIMAAALLAFVVSRFGASRGRAFQTRGLLK